MIPIPVSIQIVPAPSAPAPAWGKLVQLPAREGQGGEAQCQNCAGAGKLPLHGDACRRCDGTGRARFVTALRLLVETDAQMDEARATLRACPPGSRRQATIPIAEEGGGLTNTGHATIVAGIKGEPLPAVYGVPKCGAPHAQFYVHAALVVRYGQHRGDGEGTVSLVAVDQESGDLHAFEAPLWKFRDGDEALEVLDPARCARIDFPAAAVAAARSKARHYHCRDAHYAAAGGAHGPGGALTGAGAAFGGWPSPFKGPGIGYAPEGIR